jgi:hypothetical protein
MANKVVPAKNIKTGRIEYLSSKPAKPVPKTTGAVIKGNTNEHVENKSQENFDSKEGNIESSIDSEGIINSDTKKKTSNTVKNNVSPCSLFDFIASIYNAEKPLNHNELSKQLVKNIIDNTLTDSQIIELSSLVERKDLELKKTRLISELLIRNSCYQKDNYKPMASFLEYVFNQHLNFELIESNTLSALVQESNGERIINILVDKIDKSVKWQQKNTREKKLPNNDSQEKKIAYKILQDNLVLIAFSLLYYFKYVDGNMLFNYLSKSVFELKSGEIEDSILSHSLSFASSMVASSNKKDFSYILAYFSKYSSRYKSEVTDQKKQIDVLENENKNLKIDIKNKNGLIILSENKISDIEKEFLNLKKELTNNSEIAKHEEIHLKDVNNKNQSMFLRFLEDDVFEMLLNANKSLQSNPPNTEFTQSYLEMVIERIEDKIKCLK